MYDWNWYPNAADSEFVSAGQPNCKLNYPGKRTPRDSRLRVAGQGFANSLYESVRDIILGTFGATGECRQL